MFRLKEFEDETRAREDARAAALKEPPSFLSVPLPVRMQHVTASLRFFTFDFSSDPDSGFCPFLQLEVDFWTLDRIPLFILFF